ncbi:MAG TPA: lysophospholipase [Candidatus Dormibacteraeota bacterium]|nr:lysophospholipase [Candidatus Dormibacteraeota bacterium]
MASVILAPDPAAEPSNTSSSKGFLTSSDGTRLAYRRWPLQNAGTGITFAVIHGHGEHGGRYERFAQGMAKYGQMATYALDLRGHGESEGRRGHVDSWDQWVDDAAAFVKHVEHEAPGEVVPLGHSFGGVVMLSTVRSKKLTHIKRFILSSPALRLTKETPQWLNGTASALSKVAPQLALSNQVDAGTISRIPEVVDAYKTDPLVHGKITTRLYSEWRRASKENLDHAQAIDIPFLVLAGTDDRLIDPDVSRELHEKAPTMSTLAMLDGRYHEPFNDLDSDEVFAMIADWIRSDPRRR